MSDNTTTRLQLLLNQWLQDRDPATRDQFLSYAYDRLKHLARKMRLSFFGAARPADTDDVLHDALVRLTQAFKDDKFVNERFFEKDPPPTVRDIFSFTAYKIRLVLIDLLRKHQRGKREMALQPTIDEGDDNRPTVEPSDLTDNPPQMLNWTEFHDAVGKLPNNEREVFELIWYHELPQAEIADLLSVDVRTVKRRWQSARLLLHPLLGESQN